MRFRTILYLSMLAVALVSGLIEAADLPEPPDTERSTTRALSPADAAAQFRGPEGFHAGVFAAEPDIRNPIALAWDARGRLWVAENYTYAEFPKKFDLGLRDRVLIFEDADGDGRFDRRRVFTDDVQILTSLELGRGGVWLMCPPRLLFLPDRNRDDIPDGPAEVILDGFVGSMDNHHTFANGLRWGPDGWLYGRCGASSPGSIGIPGTPENERVPLRGGIWRYHPRLRRFEALAHGTTNPWGHDWDALGEAFFINTVNGHLWHLIPGSHLVRSHTIEPNPRVYRTIDQHADHVHWETSQPIGYVDGRPRAADDRSGGGHAHSGMMIYQADQWPAELRGKLFTLNLHGKRINVDRLERAGSGFLGRHEPDAFRAGDPWFRGIELSYGPDGAVYVLDWSDTGECHEHDGIHRSSGRIYKLTYGSPPRPTRPFALESLSPLELVKLHGHSNEWHVRQARGILADRAARGERLDEAAMALRAMVEQQSEPVGKLRALWSLHAIGRTDEPMLLGMLRHPHESIRAWSIRLLTDGLNLDTVFSRRPETETVPPAGLLVELMRLGREDPSGLVRLVLASSLQRLPVDRRPELAAALLGHAEDEADPNLPSLLWTGLIPMAESNPVALADLAAGCRIPLVLRFLARRLGEDIATHPASLNRLLEIARGKPRFFQAQVLAGLEDALTGWRKAPKPGSWDSFRSALISASDPALADRARQLDVLFGDGRALDELKHLALDDSAPLDARKSALKTLIDNRPPDLRAICERLVRVRFLNAVAVRGLTLFDDPALGEALARNYRSFHPSDRNSAIEAMVSRPSFARALLEQIRAGRISRGDLGAFQARQIRNLGDPALSRMLAEVWGETRDTAGNRRAAIATLKIQLDPATLARSDASRGRLVFERVCASCHRLHGRGAEVGPDLTGSGREDLGYLLENILDPGATVTADYRMSILTLDDGRVLSGLLRNQNEHTLTLQTPTGSLVLDRSTVERIQSSDKSLMPDGLLDNLNPREVRDLFSYLMNRTQVPLPGTGAATGPAPAR